MAAQYTIAHVSIARSDSGLTNAFLRPDLFGGGTFGPVYEPWKALRDELEQILRDTGTNLAQTGEALCLAALEYAKTDDGASQEFDRLRTVVGEPQPDPTS